MGGRARSALGGNHPAPPGRPKARAPLWGEGRAAPSGGTTQRRRGRPARPRGDDHTPPIGDPDPDDGEPDEDDFDDDFDDDEDRLEVAPERATPIRGMIFLLRCITPPH